MKSRKAIKIGRNQRSIIRVSFSKAITAVVRPSRLISIIFANFNSITVIPAKSFIHLHYSEIKCPVWHVIIIIYKNNYVVARSSRSISITHFSKPTRGTSVPRRRGTVHCGENERMPRGCNNELHDFTINKPAEFSR